MGTKFEDIRGKLFFPFKNTSKFVESTISVNHKNVFRGIHINSFEKLVTCIKGSVLDILINFNENEEDYLIPKYYLLDSKTDNFQIIVPNNYGHAFLSLEEDSILIYHFTETFNSINTKHIHYMDPFINIKLPIDNPILSIKDSEKNFIKPIDYLIFGPKGYIGSHVIKYLKKLNKNFITSQLKLQEIDKIKEIIDFYNPKFIINCAGITGVPNIFWCDNNCEETIENNITYQLTLAHICNERKIHLTVLGSAGIFLNDKFYTEEDVGNYYNNFYGECRFYLENILKKYKNLLYLRINYPISDTHSEKNLISKIINYKSIDSIEFSITYLDDLIPILFNMIENNEVGICNFTNPGAINLTKIIEIYNEKFSIKKSITINNILVDNKRSFAKLLPNKILKYQPLFINEAVEKCISILFKT